MIYQESYTVIVKKEYDNLVREVNELLSKGYVLSGSINIVQGEGTSFFRTEATYSAATPAITQNFMQALYKPVTKNIKEYL